MRPEELTALLRKRPFVPLRIHMTDGHAYDIPHPELMMVGRSHALIGLRPDHVTGVVDRTDSFALLHIVGIEELPPVASAGTTSNASE
jgi:hypothetical protein